MLGGHYRECQKQEPCRGVWGYPPPKSFQIWRLRNAIISTCHETCPQYENGKQMQVTVIKITVSEENNAIHRLDVSGSTGPGEAANPNL